MNRTLQNLAKFALLAIVFSMLILSVSADDGNDNTTLPSTLPSQEPPQIDVIPLPPEWWEDNTSETPHDFLGNTQLIDSTRVVFESNILTFISVMTRAGNVFYVLIDHRIPIDEDDGVSNVYFLTQVNEFDLLSLLYQPSDGDDTSLPPVHPNQNYTSGMTQRPSPDIVPDDNETDEPTPTSSSTGLISPFLIIILTVAVLFVVGLFVYLKVSGNKNKTSAQNDEYDDFDESPAPWETEEEIDIDDFEAPEEGNES
jgi:hypothetical protein